MSNDAASTSRHRARCIHLDKLQGRGRAIPQGRGRVHAVNCQIIEYFPTAGDAYDAGCEWYGFGNFSIQEIGAAPISLGAQSLELL